MSRPPTSRSETNGRASARKPSAMARVRALRFYHTRNFYKPDVAVFLAKKVPTEAELLAPRRLRKVRAKAAVAIPPQGS